MEEFKYLDIVFTRDGTREGSMQRGSALSNENATLVCCGEVGVEWIYWSIHIPPCGHKVWIMTGSSRTQVAEMNFLSLKFKDKVRRSESSCCSSILKGFN